jgi:ubiquinone/menaquinone biosynthesis C-methylase UbiE
MQTAAAAPNKMLLARGGPRLLVAGRRGLRATARAADGNGASTTTTTTTTAAAPAAAAYVDDQIGLATVFADMPSPPASPWPSAADRAVGGEAPASSSSSSTAEFSYTPAAAAASSPASSVRLLPINYAPETRYTVDSPADADAARFPELHPSVEFWRTFRTSMPMRTGGGGGGGGGGAPSSSSSSSSLDEARAVLRDLAATSPLEDATSAAYWAYHLGRTGFFLGASFAGALAHHLVATAEQARSPNGGGGGGGGPQKTPLENLTSAGAREVTNRLAEAIALYRQDLAEVRAGSYALPYDMTAVDPTKNAQYNPLAVAGRTLAFVREAVATLDRRVKRADTSNWLESPLFPAYYADSTFHYQSGGWLTSRSSRAYEFSTESLFFGRQDAMQRAALVPLAAWAARQAGVGAGGEGLRVLEVAAGTGRFHTFIRDNYPRARSTVSDLSPFYLERARENMRAWRRIRGGGGGGGGGGDDDDSVDYVLCKAEDVPRPDASFDVVTCTYLFHELPEEARVACAEEWRRLLRPGGLVVLTDSVQIGDRPAWDASIGAFGDFNEPHYRNYVACDVGAIFEDAGFAPTMKVTASASKTWAFVKRGGGGDGGEDGGRA